MTQVLIRLALTFIFFSSVLVVSSAHAQAVDKTASSAPNALLILDGSGSMWGKIKSGHKILVARRAIAQATRPFEGKLNLGLMSFGHRKRAACLDIQVLQRPAPLNPLHYSRLVKQIKPIGKTPITSALNTAATTLKRGQSGGSIILLADGPENCRKDPCQLISREFAQQNKLKVHVIAFSMLPKDARSLKCLAQNSGGEFYTPSDEKSLETALSAAFKASLQGGAARKVALKTPKPKKVVVKAGVKLTAHLGANSPALTKGVSWKVEKLLNKTTLEKDLPPWTSSTAKTEFDLSPGLYRIVADFDEYQVIRDIEIKKNQRDAAQFVFNLSHLKLPAGWGLPDSRSGFGKLLLEKQSDNSKEKREEILLDLSPQAQNKLIPSGAYKISAIDNGKMQNWFIHAEPGKAIAIPVWKKTGRIRFKLQRADNGAPLSSALLKLYRTDLRQDKLVEVARSFAGSPQFDLEPGKYLAHLKDGYSEARFSFSIQAGTVLEEVLSLNQGFLKVNYEAKNPDDLSRLEIMKIDQVSGSKFIAELSDFSEIIKLSPGQYRLNFRVSQTARASLQDIVIKSGKTKTLSLKPRLSEVTFLVSKKNDALSRHQIFWQLFDKKGRMIWQSSEAEPRVLLSSGTYKVVAEIGSDRFQSKIRIKARAPKTFDLSDKKAN